MVLPLNQEKYESLRSNIHFLVEIAIPIFIKSKAIAINLSLWVYAITYKFLNFVVVSILKGIANNFSELINEFNHFYLPNLGEEQTTSTGVSGLGITVAVRPFNSVPTPSFNPLYGNCYTASVHLSKAKTDLQNV